MFPQVVHRQTLEEVITNNHSIAYSVSNIGAKNYQHLLMYVEVMMCNIGVIF